MNPERRSMTGIALTWTKFILALAVYLITIGTIYGTMHTQLDELRAQVKELHEKAIIDGQFKEFKEDIERRLQRIEDKIDRERSLQELH